MTDYSSPYKEAGMCGQAGKSVRKKIVLPPTISKSDVRGNYSNHRWVVSYIKGRMKKACSKCGKPAFAVEFDRCRK